MTTQAIRVVLADDHTGLRKGIRYMLERAGNISIVGEAGNGAEAIDLVDQYRPDVLLLDVELPIKRGDEVARYIKKRGWDVKILALSSYDDRQYVRGMLNNGAAGYLTKDEAPAKLIDAIRKVAGGQKGLMSRRAKGSTGPLLPTRKTLSRREMQILTEMEAGKSDKEIAQLLGIESNKIDDYLRLLLRKFGVEDKDELLRIARREKLL